MSQKQIIDVIKVEETTDLVNGVVTFKTGLIDILAPGEFGILLCEENNNDKVIMNPLYTGGELLVKMKLLSRPAKMYKSGDKIANLLIIQ